MISVIKVFYKDTPVMFNKDGRYPKHIAFLDQAEGLPQCPVLWGVCYIVQVPSMEDITRMMGNVTSAVCGRATSIASEQRQEGKTTNSKCKKVDSTEAAKVRDTSQLRNRMDTMKVSSKKSS
jgi:hypothetical protein